MTRDHGFRARALFHNATPVPQEPFWFLAQRFGHLSEPGADEETVVQACEKINPSLNGIDGDLNLACKIGIDELLSAVFRENLHQCFQSPEIGDQRHFAQVFARQLCISEGAPAASEPAIAAK